ncbi:MAG: SIS domain-containing protein, partial [bacterium]|nr:SIS domain-containing protein [bacterium]
GNTEETLSSVESALKVGAKIVAVTTGGKLKEMIDEGVIAGAVVNDKETNPSRFPKSGLGVSFGALAGVLSKIGVIKLTKEELQKSLDELAEIRKSWDAKARANWFVDSIPVLFSGRPFLGALNAGRNAVCEIGRVFTLFFDFPEVNHVLVEATQRPEFVTEKMKYLFFESNFHHLRVKKRFEITKKIFDEQGLQHSTYALKGTSILTQALELAHYCAWLGYHLSLLRNEDPGPEPWITKLKESLSQQ